MFFVYCSRFERLDLVLHFRSDDTDIELVRPLLPAIGTEYFA